MSKRSGNFVTLADVVEEVGRDPVRFMMLFRKSDAPLDFDFQKVTEQSKDNPVFYLQYAHARIHSTLRKAGVEPGSDNLDRLGADELALVREAAQFPRVVEAAAKARKPIIAAVAGYALGGGCELAMMCDFILAADTAKFGQPEINLGVIPGAGGTQRLTRFVGKSKAMEMCLTGRMMDAEEAERCGLVSRIIAADDLVEEAVSVATKIAEKSLPSVYTAKECVDVAYETSLREGVHYERRVFHALFAFDDQSEGMEAFIEKRAPKFTHK